MARNDVVIPRSGPDELQEFAILARRKFLRGRKQYERLGVKVYQADTIQECQQELLDASNFCAVLYWELERMRKKFNYKPEVRKMEPKGG